MSTAYPASLTCRTRRAPSSPKRVAHPVQGKLLVRDAVTGHAPEPRDQLAEGHGLRTAEIERHARAAEDLESKYGEQAQVVGGQVRHRSVDGDRTREHAVARRAPAHGRFVEDVHEHAGTDDGHRYTRAPRDELETPLQVERRHAGLPLRVQSRRVDDGHALGRRGLDQGARRTLLERPSLGPATVEGDHHGVHTLEQTPRRRDVAEIGRQRLDAQSRRPRRPLRSGPTAPKSSV